MNLPKITPITIFLLLSCISYAQIELKGVVKNASNTTIEFANVVLTNEKNEIVKGTVTDKSGSFKLLIKEGNYRLTISFVGYLDWKKSISISKDVDLGNLFLNENKNELNEVVITVASSNVRFKKGIIRYDINNKQKISSINTAKVINKLPGINVSKKDITINGRSGVIVKVNGKMKFLNSKDALVYLNSLSSENILQVEINNTPNSKYGNNVNGIINLILKKDITQGINGTNQMYFDTGKYSNFGGSIFLNYRKQNVNIYANIKYDNENNIKEKTSDILYSKNNLNIEVFDSKKDQPNKYSNQIGIDYTINNKNFIGFTTNLNFEKTNTKNLNKQDYFSDGTLNSISSLNESSEEKYNRVHLNLNYEGILDTVYKQKITFNLNYITDNKDQNSSFLQDFSNIQNTTSNLLNFNGKNSNSISLKGGNIDYQFFFKNGFEIYSGTKFIQTNTINDLTYTSINNDLPSSIIPHSTSDYKENLFNYYVSLMKYKPVLGYEIGVRYESVNINGDDTTGTENVNKTFSGFYPNLLIRYNASKNNRLVLQAKKFLGRPNFHQLNPNIRYINPNSIIQGNINLKQYNSYLLSLRYTYKKKYSAFLRYDYSNNFIPQTLFSSESDNIIKSTYENAGKLSGIQFMLNIPIKITNNWNMKHYLNSFFITSKSINSNFEGLNYTTSNFYYRITNSISLNNNYFIDIYAAYKSRYRINQTTINPMYIMDISINKSFFNKKLKSSLSITDVFYSSKEKGIVAINGVSNIFSKIIDNRRLELSLSYDFGSKKIKSNKYKDDGIGYDKTRLE